MLKLLRELDQFGVVFQPRIKYSRDQYKTYCGGIMSIMLYGLSLTYLVYLFFQWRTGQILPKISSMSVVEEQQQLTYEDTFIQVKFRQYANTTIDPFDEKAIVLQPLYYIFKNGVAQLQPYQPQYTIQQSSGKFNIMNISNLNIAISDIKNDDDADIEYMLTFGDCQKMLLKEGQQCANSTIVQEFYKQPTNTIIIKQFVQEFSSDTGRVIEFLSNKFHNSCTKSLQIIPREYLIPIQRNYTYYARTYVQITKTSVDAGILFEQWEFYSHITDYRFVSATVETSYISDVMRYNIPLALFYSFHTRIFKYSQIKWIKKLKHQIFYSGIGRIKDQLYLKNTRIIFCLDYTPSIQIKKIISYNIQEKQVIAYSKLSEILQVGKVQFQKDQIYNFILKLFQQKLNSC